MAQFIELIGQDVILPLDFLQRGFLLTCALALLFELTRLNLSLLFGTVLIVKFLEELAQTCPTTTGKNFVHESDLVGRQFLPQGSE